jgi:integrase
MGQSFKSGLAEDIHAFLLHKRSLGYKYQSGEFTLHELDSYCYSSGLEAKLNRNLVESWIIAKEAAHPSPYRSYISPVREFGRFLQDGRDPNAYIVADRFTMRNYRPTPYFLTETEISSFFRASEWAISSNRGPGRSIVYPPFFMLMHCCGLRTVEARSILIADVHLEKEQGFIDIRASKGHRERRVFLSESLRQHLAVYDIEVGRIFNERLYFFPSSEKCGLSASAVCANFNKIWDAAGLRNPAGKQPRPYSFRHHFAFANINRWTESGKNVNAMLPYLMRFMGHGSISSTYYYIHLVPDFFPVLAKMTKSLEELIPEVDDEKQ